MAISGGKTNLGYWPPSLDIPGEDQRGIQGQGINPTGKLDLDKRTKKTKLQAGAELFLYSKNGDVRKKLELDILRNGRVTMISSLKNEILKIFQKISSPTKIAISRPIFKILTQFFFR